MSALTQVAVLRALVAVCGHTQSHTVRDSQTPKHVRRSEMRVCDLSSRNHLRRIPLCRCSGMNPWCCDSQRCCCTCASHSSTRPDLKPKMYESCRLLPHYTRNDYISCSLISQDNFQDTVYSMFYTRSLGLVGIPVHLRPSPIHPGAQSHLKLPAVLVQVACLSQLWAPISHSFISERKKKFVI